MDKSFILSEIRRTAEANGGIPLGQARFQGATGINQTDWFAKHWKSWGDAVREAGYEPQKFQQAFDEDDIIAKLVDLIRELGHYPVAAELRMKARDARDFPSHNVFERIGTKAERASKVMKYCAAAGGFDDVIAICRPIAKAPSVAQNVSDKTSAIGFVYLVKSGRFHKIGRTNAVGRREYELAIQLPEETRQYSQGVPRFTVRHGKRMRSGASRWIFRATWRVSCVSVSCQTCRLRRAGGDVIVAEAGAGLEAQWRAWAS